MYHDLGRRQHEIHWHWLLTRTDQRESPAELTGEESGFWCYGRGQMVALGGPSGQAENPSPLSRRRHWPLPLVGRYLGHNPQPPAPPKGDWPVEADQARLTPLPGQPQISRSDHSLSPDPCGRLRGLGMTISERWWLYVVNRQLTG